MQITIICYCLLIKHFKKEISDAIRNTKKNVAMPTIMAVTIELISNAVEAKTKVEISVPNVPASKHLRLPDKHLVSVQHELLQELSTAKTKRYTNTALAIPKALHIPAIIKGVSPRENRTATITPAIIPKTVPPAPHPQLQLQPVLLCVFIFINSLPFIL